MATSQEEVGSDQIRSALDQLTYVKRLLQGDQALSLEDILSSANAAQITEGNTDEEGDGMIPTGGLHDGLPSLLLPLLRMKGTNEQIGMENAYEPRKYLTLANSLARRFGSETDEAGQAGNAIQLARIFGQPKPQYLDKDLLLERRKRRRQDGSLGLVDANSTENVWSETLESGTDSANKLSKLDSQAQTIPSRSTHQFPGQDRSIDIIKSARSEVDSKDAIDQDGQIQVAIHVWQSTLSQIDAEAAASLQCSTYWLRKNLIRLRIDIDQVGTAIIWIVIPEGSEKVFDNQIQIQKINILAETEMQELEEAASDDTSSNNHLGNLHFSSPSSFPIYRRLRAQLLAKVLESTSLVSKVDGTTEGQEDSSVVDRQWKIFFSTLFALAGLSHLHDPFVNFAQLSNQPARGTTAVLSAFAGWDVGV